MSEVEVKETVDHDKRRRNRNIIIGVAVVVLIVAAALVAYFVTQNNSGSGSSSTSNNATATANPTAGVSASPLPLSNKKLFGYWGQSAIGNGVGLNGTGTRLIPNSDQQKPLAYYCDLGYYQTMNIAFLYAFGGGDSHWGLDLSSLGRYEVDANGVVTTSWEQIPISPDVFLKVGDDIKHCQAKGIKVVLSLGGDMHSPYQFIAGDGARLANVLYNAFLDGKSATRPFGTAVLDGIELDVEKTDSAYTQEQIIFLQTLKQLSPKIILSAVPQCYLNGGLGMDINTGPVIKAVPELLDYVIIQYYNNPSCSYPFGFNFNRWKALYSGPLVVGLAGDVTSAITGGFLPPPMLQAVVDEFKNDPQFYGISVYDVSSSNPSPSLNTNYSLTLRKALNGDKVGSGYGPQGNFTTMWDWDARCGPTWNYANETCGLVSCKNVWSCADPKMMCFSFLSSC
ncbi:glycoside hydrolase [Rhizoclosmatium globosum]|uniref:Glycoside hydrolase n=1 Tax=Rhizoclosmatium globosum TaxID=329046 RepID=A0A1Y2D2V7_9FUNG|nr:glycoside hydrolase [Rhizoclosmatium globosum]|eukprot:ORY53633.1 glycoside hydrolase [Rhizoclosmatium globosum]